MPKVTVIMPSLNVVKYIRPCMESVLAQTLQDIEILAIDAGSTDGTKEILEEYARKDERVKVIHSDKRSYGYQMNMGIELAAGEYVGIVETDDMIENDMFELLYDTAVKSGVDYVKGTAQHFLEVAPEITVKRRIACVPETDDIQKVLKPCEYPELFVTDRFLWMGIYRLDFIKKIKLNETPGAAYQDIGFMFQVISGADSAVYLDHDVYYYRQDNKNASAYNIKAFSYLVEEYTYVKQFLEGKGSKWYCVYYRKMLNQCMGRFQIMAVSGQFWDQAYRELEILQSWFIDAVQKGFLCEKDAGKELWRRLQIFFESPKALYEEYREIYRQKTEYINNIFSFIGNRKVIVFGSGAYGKFFHALMENKRPGAVLAYCDNNEKLWNTKIQGIMVLAPKEAVGNYPNEVYVIANKKNAEELQAQLRAFGIADGQMCLCQAEVNLNLFISLQSGK